MSAIFPENTDPVEEPTELAPTDTSGEEDAGGNPAWKDLLANVPDSLHHVITPHLQKWDKSVENRFQKLQQDSSVYEPYKEFVDQGVDPQSIQQAMAVMSMINDNPDQFFREMQTFYKDDPRFAQQQENSQGQTESLDLGEQQPQFDLESDPRFQTIAQQQEIIAQFLAGQVAEQEQSEADAALDQEVKGLQEKYGAFDEEFVFGLANAGVDIEVAVQRYQNLISKARNPVPGSNLPNVVSPGGGVPSTAVDVGEMDRKSTRALIQDFLSTQER